MTTEEFILALFCRIEEGLRDVEKDKRANLYPSELVTLAILFALKAGRQKSFLQMGKQQLEISLPSLAGAHPSAWSVQDP